MTSILTFASLKTLKKVHSHSVLLSFYFMGSAVHSGILHSHPVIPHQSILKSFNILFGLAPQLGGHNAASLGTAAKALRRCGGFGGF